MREFRKKRGYEHILRMTSSDFECLLNLIAPEIKKLVTAGNQYLLRKC